MGLLSHLRERKECKILLILNDEAMEEETDFKTYYEKVVDTSLRFSPTPEYCARIGLANNPVIEGLAESCIALGISNIRVIQKIDRATRRVEPLLRSFDNQVLHQAVKSLALFGWVLFEPKRAPSLEYIQKRPLVSG